VWGKSKVKSSQVNNLPKAKSQAKDKRAKDSSLLHVLGRSAKTDESGRSFAVLSTQIYAALEASRGAVAAGG
jgi:hypothetical protein